MTKAFDILTSGAKGWWFPCFGLIFIVVGAAMIRAVLIGKIDKKKAPLPFLYIWTGFAILWTALSGFSVFGEYFRLTDAISKNTFQHVEGVVENFVPMPYQGHSNESFTVQGVTFEYSDFGVTNGFNNTRSHGGPIREGQYVSIDYFQGKILRLWIRKN